MEGRIRVANSFDNDYIETAIKESILLSVDSHEKNIFNLWINSTLSIAMDSIVNKKMNDEVFILENNNKKIGFLWMGVSVDQFTCEPVGYILGIFVNEDERHNGYGKQLMKYAEKWCYDKKLYSIELNVGANNPACEFYDHLGFSNRSVVKKKTIL